MSSLEALIRPMVEDLLNRLATSLSLSIAPETAEGLTQATAVLLAALALIVALFILRTVFNCIMRLIFRSHFHVALPRGCRVRPRLGSGAASFSFQFPRWRYARKDGGRDRRRSGNRVIRGKNILNVGAFKVISTSPLNLMTLVSRLRDAGETIPPCPAEEQKLVQARCQLRQRRALVTAQSVNAAFAHDPTQFESYCAALFSHLGYQASVTPKTNDGGFDLVMTSPDGRSCIAECKCFAEGHVVGRPLVQKLVGANQTQRAQCMMFITTSSFSSEARAYAMETGVELIDGERLSQLMARARAQDSLGSVAWDSSFAFVDRTEWELTRDDILAGYPPDLR